LASEDDSAAVRSPGRLEVEAAVLRFAAEGQATVCPGLDVVQVDAVRARIGERRPVRRPGLVAIRRSGGDLRPIPIDVGHVDAVRVRDWCWTNGDVDHLISLIRPENYQSRRVAEKLGMTVWRETIRAGFRHSVYRLDRPNPVSR